jgi:hypothetical protein
MNGAREFGGLGIDGVHGRLYISTGSHARGRTLHIYVLPVDVEYYDNKKPKIDNAVEVYGILGGQPGWTERYGWKHQGKWVNDFNEIVSKAKALKESIKQDRENTLKTKELDEKTRNQVLLNNY